MSHNRALLAVVAALLACSRSDAGRGAASDAPPRRTASAPPLPHAACFAAESLRARPITFGKLLHDEAETGDWSGAEFTFMLDSTGLTGSVRDARGELPPALPLHDVRYDAVRDSISFWYATPSGTRYYYSLQPRCARLIGTGRLFVTKDNPTGTLVRDTSERVLHPPPAEDSVGAPAG